VRGLAASLGFGFVALSFALPRSARAFDLLDAFAFLSDIKSRAMGYRGEMVDVGTLDGKSCKLYALKHVAPDSGPLTVMLHGFGDSRLSWRGYITLLKNRGLPYKNFVVLEWPRHGKSECDQVEDLSQAAKAVDLAIKAFERQDPSHPFTGSLSASLGVAVDAYLSELEPRFTHEWIAPPLLSPQPLERVIELVRKIHSPNTLQAFLERVQQNPRRRFPNWVLEDVLKRAQRAQAFVDHIHVDELHGKVLAIPPSQMKIYFGSRDRLVNVPDLDPAILEHFKGHIHYVNCGHGIAGACPGELMDSKRPY
jgi:pimeloyl-ACP methyl ester carboxylesterase